MTESPFGEDPKDRRSRSLPNVLLVVVVLAALSFLLTPLVLDGHRAYQSVDRFLSFWSWVLRSLGLIS